MKAMSGIVISTGINENRTADLRNSFYWLDPTVPHASEVKVIKPKDPELMKANKDIIIKSKAEAERRKQKFIMSFSDAEAAERKRVDRLIKNV